MLNGLRTKLPARAASALSAAPRHWTRAFAATSSQPNPFQSVHRQIQIDNAPYSFYSLPELNDPRVAKLPYSIRILLESAVRNCDEYEVTAADVDRILRWHDTAGKTEIAFKPARVLLQDFTGVPAVVDLASMRDAVARLGGDATRVNPLVPVDLVVDHSVQVDFFRSPDALKKNLDREMARNRERFEFLKWGAKAFDNFRIVPPGSGIVHQVNLEYLARSVFERDGLLYPDSVVGTDSHTTMIDGLGVVGWGVGGIEAESVMMGQAVSMVLPEVVGYRLKGELPQHITATDLVLTITQELRALGVVGKFVEFFGPGMASLSLADRATIANMAPEYGATMGFFGVDDRTIEYLRQTNRPEHQVRYIEQYLKENQLFVDYDAEPEYSHVLELDLDSLKPCVAGPKRPEDRIELDAFKAEWEAMLARPAGFQGFGLPDAAQKTTVPVTIDGETYELSHGSVAIAAITSCTNTSNPNVMLGAGLLAKNALAKGMKVPRFVKTSLAPGSGVAEQYLERSGLQTALDELGFNIVAFGCTTCIGNSGDLVPEVSEAISSGDLVAAAALSGNRNFEGRVHPEIRAAFLASPMLVVAYALAGTVDFDFEKDPLGEDPATGAPVFLRDIWPSSAEIQEVVNKNVLKEMFEDVYSHITDGTESWQALEAPDSLHYPWNEESTYIHQPPFFSSMGVEPAGVSSIQGAHCLANFGDSVTTDHISPAGPIAPNSPAAKFLKARGVERLDFNTYGSRRGNDLIMARGTFANVRLVNKFFPGEQGPNTLHVPSGEKMAVFDAAEKYQKAGVPTIILAGKNYGSGSSRDWAAKGPHLQGVKVVIAESFERIHRSNLVGMGVVPLQFLDGENADTVGLTGKETFDVELSKDTLLVGNEIDVRVHGSETGVTAFRAKLRLDTQVELDYIQHGGILNYVIRKMLP